jgi:hypothetical protein
MTIPKSKVPRRLRKFNETEFPLTTGRSIYAFDAACLPTGKEWVETTDLSRELAGVGFEDIIQLVQEVGYAIAAPDHSCSTTI